MRVAKRIQIYSVFHLANVQPKMGEKVSGLLDIGPRYRKMVNRMDAEASAQSIHLAHAVSGSIRACSPTIGLRSMPKTSEEMTHTSLGFIQSGGFRASPTPPGVPV